ncbi:metallophosphoesterase family protein [Rhizobium sp. LjRoot254]|uniref:metallophosphoesterase family protein n=1 Tax=Rhizobium sp. LjRoot254 TaxID=3342297 RepID=UPI003ECC914E
MLRDLLPRLFGSRKSDRKAPIRPRLHESHMPDVIYAIGDIHGCHKLLRQLESAIAADADGIDGEKWLVCLGDYIDRGPSSAMVLDHLLSAPPSGFKRVCLAGNHEEIAFDFLINANYNNGWLDFGGRETLASYGLYDLDRDTARLGRQLASHIPEDHLQFLGALPSMLTVPGYCFVHAGVDPLLPLADQREQVLLWSRPPDFIWPDAGTGYRVIHGHTPIEQPDLAQQRINIDLGAYATGKLGALKITGTGDISVILAS